jgi:malonyl-CoA O-methyltransferase
VLEPAAAYALWAATYSPAAHNPFMRAEERAMLALLSADLRGLRVCDAGCGTGRYLLHARARGAAQMVGFDLSEAMLRRARDASIGARDGGKRGPIGMACADLTALPLASAAMDVIVCALALGHVQDLRAALGELRRVTRPGGTVLCSELHPAGEARGWQRTFKVDGTRFAVRHSWRSLSDWESACRRVGLQIMEVVEPRLDPADIPDDAHFDRAALTMPVALALRLRRADGR